MRREDNLGKVTFYGCDGLFKFSEDSGPQWKQFAYMNIKPTKSFSIPTLQDLFSFQIHTCKYTLYFQVISGTNWGRYIFSLTLTTANLMLIAPLGLGNQYITRKSFRYYQPK